MNNTGENVTYATLGFSVNALVKWLFIFYPATTMAWSVWGDDGEDCLTSLWMWFALTACLILLKIYQHNKTLIFIYLLFLYPFLCNLKDYWDYMGQFD